MKRKIICPCWDSKSNPLAVQPVTILTVLLAVTVMFEYVGTGKHGEAYETQVSHCIEVCAIMLPHTTWSVQEIKWPTRKTEATCEHSRVFSKDEERAVT
jgi:hypothetical protein